MKLDYIFNEIDDIIDNNNLVLDLYLFGSAEDEGRTEQPTEYKKQKSREEGKVAYSQDAVSTSLLFSSSLFLFLSSEYMISKMQSFLIENFSKINYRIDIMFFKNLFTNSIYTFLICLTPFFFVIIVFILFANIIQVGFKFSYKVLELKFHKISFTFEKLKNKLFSTRAYFVLFKASFNVALLTSIAFLIIKYYYSYILITIHRDLYSSISMFSMIIFLCFMIISCFLAIISIPDFFFQQSQYIDSIKMSKYDVKEELKHSETNPLFKNRIIDAQKKIIQSNLPDIVPKSTVVIVNPIHYAVALKYDEGMNAPLVTAKGVDMIAIRIKNIAIENNVELVENKLLARSLYANTNIGEEIPEDFYHAVSEIIAFILNSKNKL